MCFLVQHCCPQPPEPFVQSPPQCKYPSLALPLPHSKKTSMATTAVKVALRVRPLLGNESSCRECITILKDEPKIVVGSDQSFTFDYVYSPTATQAELYAKSVAPLLDRFAEGNHVTILAYGQEGSGKTYSLDTGTDPQTDPGILRRLISQLFERLNKESIPDSTYQVYLSYLDLVNEDIIDLLAPQPTEKDPKRSIMPEPDVGGTSWSRLHEERLDSAEQLDSLMRKGAQRRATEAVTRSRAASQCHTVITILLKQHQVGSLGQSQSPSLTSDGNDQPGRQKITKFHLFDLTGSDMTQWKPKDTFGDRRKKGISINTSLMALRSVISALGEEPRMARPYVPYDSSTLIQLLQESLGANSHALMLACVSPSEADYASTIDTLKYAVLAQNIQKRREARHDDATKVNSLENKVYSQKLQAPMLRTMSLLEGQEAELAHERSFAIQLAADLVAAQSERDTLLIKLQNAGVKNDSATVEAHPLIRHYLDTIQQLRFQIQEAHNRLAYMESSQNANLGENEFLKIGVTSSAALPGRFGSYARRTFRLGSVSTGRKKQRQHIPIQHRMKRTASHSISHDDLLPYEFDLVGLSPFRDIKSGTNTAHMQTIDIFIWSQSKDETVVHGSGEGRQEARPSPFEDCAAELTGSCAEMQLLDTQPDLLQTDEQGHELEVLDGPTWADVPKTQSTTGSTKRESLSWTDSVIDDSDNSVTDSVVDDSDHSVATSRLSGPARPEGGLRGRRRSKDLLKLLHQVQADMLVKRELIGQLEKSEDEYTQMRSSYEAKLSDLQERLVDFKRERGAVLRSSQPKESGASNVMQLREGRQTQEVRSLYETKLKRMSMENLDLKKKHTQANHSLHASRVKAEALINRLKSSVESLKLEKKQMQRAAKAEADKARDKLAAAERDIQALTRREATLIDRNKKLEETTIMQAQLLKKRSDETTMVSVQMRQLTASLRKAAGEGAMLNEVSLEKILSAFNASSGSNTSNTSNTNNHTLHSPAKPSMRTSTILDT